MNIDEQIQMYMIYSKIVIQNLSLNDLCSQMFENKQY